MAECGVKKIPSIVGLHRLVGDIDIELGDLHWEFEFCVSVEQFQYLLGRGKRTGEMALKPQAAKRRFVAKQVARGFAVLCSGQRRKGFRNHSSTSEPSDVAAELP